MEIPLALSIVDTLLEKWNKQGKIKIQFCFNTVFPSYDTENNTLIDLLLSLQEKGCILTCHYVNMSSTHVKKVCHYYGLNPILVMEGINNDTIDIYVDRRMGLRQVVSELLLFNKKIKK